LQILIDGDYARDRRGTGISTYARTLAAALSNLGHGVEWLSGASGGDPRESLADAAAIFDTAPDVRGPRAWARTAGRMTAGVLAGSVQARLVERSKAILPPEPNQSDAPAHLAPELFVRAHYRHMLLRQFTDVSVNSRIDVLHLTAPLPVSMKGVKRVVTIHDLVPIRLPYATPDNKAEFIARVRRCAREADLIITVSEASKADIAALLDIDAAKIAVTYQPSDLEPLSPEESSRLPLALSRFGLAPDNYLLCVGAQEPKKNIRRLIEAFLEVDTAMPLVLAGPRGWMWETEVGAALAPLGDKARERIRFTGYLDRDDLRNLYAGAFAFVFPSLYEGFGLPVLEAMKAGAPVITSNISSLPEICGETGALFVNPQERSELRQAIERMMSDQELRARLRKGGPDRAKAFSFEAYLERLTSAYSRL
jgi:glycosyltransferase involved in cell wall biosynthesis